MTDSNLTDIEKRDLEAHVSLCAERYDTLNDKLDNLEKRTSNIEVMIQEIRNRLFTTEGAHQKRWLKIAGYIIAGLFSMVVGLTVYSFQRIEKTHDEIQKSEQTKQKTPKKQRTPVEETE